MGQPKSVALSCKIYHRLLSLLPAESFLREDEGLMLSDFRHQCIVVHYQRGDIGVFFLWPALFVYTFRDLGYEHTITLKKNVIKFVKKFTQKAPQLHPIKPSTTIQHQTSRLKFGKNKLLEALAQDMTHAFPDLMKSYHPQLFHFINSKVQNRDIAEDIAQECWRRVYRALVQYEASKIQSLQLRAWLFTIARHQIEIHNSKDHPEALIEDLKNMIRRIKGGETDTI